MGLSTKGPITPRRGSWAAEQLKRRHDAVMASGDWHIQDAINVASIREQIRIFGLDHVRGL